MEEIAAPRFYREDGISTADVPLFVDDAKNSFWNAEQPDIRYKMWVERIADREGISVSEIFLTMEFYSGTTSRVIEHIEYLNAESKRIWSHKNHKQRVLVSSAGDGVGEEKLPLFMIYEFATTSKFDNFFSEEANIVRADLDKFTKDREAYERIGRPWTYTVLNEGPPGVGKTKLVKALAHKTGRTLIVLNLKHILNTQMLYAAFHSSVISGEHIPHDQRLYYIPEVDTQMCSMLKPRTRNNTIIGDTETVVVQKPNNNQTNVWYSQPPTLGEILNVIDGVPERHGHILVMDTNHAADLDPALIRPGRVDRIVSWGRMSSISSRAYIENYYVSPIPKHFVVPDKKYTAAELQALVYHNKDLKECIAALTPVQIKTRHGGKN